MIEPKPFAFVLLLAASLGSGSSCAEEADEGPTQDEMQKVAAEACEQSIMCGFIPDEVTVEECIANQLGSYQDAPECLAVYYYDECQTALTCEEIDRLVQYRMGPCLDEFNEARRVTCVP